MGSKDRSYLPRLADRLDWDSIDLSEWIEILITDDVLPEGYDEMELMNSTRPVNCSVYTVVMWISAAATASAMSTIHIRS
jgi:hypothetical protein